MGFRQHFERLKDSMEAAWERANPSVKATAAEIPHVADVGAAAIEHANGPNSGLSRFYSPAECAIWGILVASGLGKGMAVDQIAAETQLLARHLREQLDIHEPIG